MKKRLFVSLIKYARLAIISLLVVLPVSLASASPATTSIDVADLAPTYRLTDAFGVGTPGVQPGNVTVTGDTFYAASVTITGGFVAGDQLDLLGSPVAGFAGAYNAGTGKLMLTDPTGGTAADLQAALNAVRFTTNNANTGLRTLTYSLNEADGTIIRTCAGAGQGHYYKFVDIVDSPNVGWDTNWTVARSAAINSYFLGWQGYLVHINSQAENDCVYNWQLNTGHDAIGGEAAHIYGSWIGLYSGSPESGGPYWWIDGPYEVVTYTNWEDSFPFEAAWQNYVLMFDAGSDGPVVEGTPTEWGNYWDWGTTTFSYAGSYVIEYGGTTADAGVMIDTATVNVAKANATTTLGSSVNPAQYGQAFTLTATVTTDLPADGNPSGTVSFMRNGVNIPGCINVPLVNIPPWQAACTPTVPDGWGVPGSPHTVTAVYSGDANFNGSNGALAGGQQFIRTNTTATITAGLDFPDPSGIGQCYFVPFGLAANAPGGGIGTATGTVTVSDGTDTCTAAVGAGGCTLISSTIGAKNLTATYNGDVNFNPSPASAVVPHNVWAPPVITGLVPFTGTAGDDAFVLTVNGNNFTQNSVVEWDGAARPTTWINANQLTALINAEDVATPWVYDVTVFPGCSAPHSDPMPYFNNEPGVGVAGFNVQTGADPTAVFGGVTADALGTGTLTVAQYIGNPTDMLLIGANGLYYDVHLHPPGSFSEVFLQFCGLSQINYIYFWNGVHWLPAQPASYNFNTRCWEILVTNSTIPNILDLEGAILGVGLGGVEVVPSFADVPPTHWAWSWIKRLAQAGITKGCSAMNYCPEAATARSQMAVFLERGMRGAAYVPPAGTGNIFVDVLATHWAAGWIEQLYADGITTGCMTSPLAFCPEGSISRAEMAVFLLRAKHGAAYLPPAATGVFVDVPTSHWAANWIEQLYAEGITSGCRSIPLSYCAEDPVTRAEMAKFLVITFNLP